MERATFANDLTTSGPEYFQQAQPVCLLALSTGLRRGELLSLRWSDQDVERDTLTVRQSVAILAGAPSIQAPKTAAARRAVKLSADVVAALSAHRVQQVAVRLQASTWEDFDLIFCTSAGRPLNPNDIYRNYEAIVARQCAEDSSARSEAHARHTIACGWDADQSSVGAARSQQDKRYAGHLRACAAGNARSGRGSH
jgi:integrase